MTTVLVVCGAGASSTFLVHRMRAVAAERMTGLDIVAGALADYDARVRDVDVVLVGQHLTPRFAELAAVADAAGSVAVLLPLLSYDTDGAGVALDAAASALEARPTGDATDEHRDDARPTGQQPSRADRTDRTDRTSDRAARTEHHSREPENIHG